MVARERGGDQKNRKMGLKWIFRIKPSDLFWIDKFLLDVSLKNLQFFTRNFQFETLQLC